MTNSIVKGKTFERTCANLLTAKLGVKIQRVPCSGGMATAQDIQDPRFKGDLFCEDEKYKGFVMECKITGKALKLDDLFINEKSAIWRWWTQTTEETGTEHTPILFFKYRGSEIYCMARDDLDLLHFKIRQVAELKGAFGPAIGVLRLEA